MDKVKWSKTSGIAVRNGSQHLVTIPVHPDPPATTVAAVHATPAVIPPHLKTSSFRRFFPSNPARIPNFFLFIFCVGGSHMVLSNSLEISNLFHQNLWVPKNRWCCTVHHVCTWTEQEFQEGTYELQSTAKVMLYLLLYHVFVILVSGSGARITLIRWALPIDTWRNALQLLTRNIHASNRTVGSSSA